MGNIVRYISVVLISVLFLSSGAVAKDAPRAWKKAWPATDFSRHSVALDEITGGGPPKDGIPAIDAPQFAPLSRVRGLGEKEPLIVITVNGQVKGYPLRILLWHEIVNDVIGGVPVAVTYCPLCDSAIVFDRRVDGKVLDFGTTGKLRNSDLVMYDRQSESWWQQFVGEAIVGDYMGTLLKIIPSRVESVARFRQRGPESLILTPPKGVRRNYGTNPYAGYDRQPYPVSAFVSAEMPKGIAPMARVVRVGRHAWPLKLLKKKGTIKYGVTVITWEPGQNSALDKRLVTRGRDIGNVVVQKETDKGLVDAVYDVTFAFAFHAFFPDGTIHRR